MNLCKNISLAECINVCIRIRPLLPKFEDEEAWTINRKTNSVQSIIDLRQSLQYNNNELSEMSLKERKRLLDAGANQMAFSFDNLEGPEVKTQQIFNKVGKKIVKQVLDGFHGAILCYGQTTSGKTFTMLGTPENPGILPCSIREVFLDADKVQGNILSVWISYMEIYNENVNDLLCPGNTNLKIVDDQKWGTVVNGLKMERVWNFEQAILLLNYGEEHRIYRETSIHEHSSRSHTIFRIYLVDLAGSERLHEQETKQDIIGETGYINKSLFVIANVINKLAEGKKQHIPYRDSKLTRILSQALGGNSLTSIICCVSPAVCNFSQTVSTFRFASRAKTVQNKAKINEIVEIEQMCAADAKKLQESLLNQQQENEFLRQESEQLKIQIDEMSIKIQQYQQENEDLLNNLQCERTKSEALEVQLRIQSNNNSQNQKKDAIVCNQQHQFQQFPSQQVQLLQQQLTSTSEQEPKVLNIELNFLDSILFYINPLVEDELSNTVDNENKMYNYLEKIQKIKSKYKLELLQIQNQYRDSLGQIIKQIIDGQAFKEVQSFFTNLNQNIINQEELCVDQELINNIDQQQVFRNIKYDIIQNFGIQNKQIQDEQLLKSNLEIIQQQIDQCYEQARTDLEIIFRKRIQYFQSQIKDQIHSKSENQQQNNVLRLTNEHQQKLNELRSQYEREIQKLENFQQNQYQQNCLQQTQIPIINNNSNNNENNCSYENNIQQNRIQQDKSKNNNRKGRAQSLFKDNEAGQRQSQQPQQFQQYVQTQQKNLGLIIQNDDGRELQNISNRLNQQQVSTFKGQTQIQKSTNSQEEKAQIKQKGQIVLSFLNTHQQKKQPMITYLWGSGKDGRLGMDDEKPQKFPKSLDKIKFITLECGYHTTAAISNSGQLYTWGRGNRGQLGLGDSENHYSPSLVDGLKQQFIVSVKCGWQHSIALTIEGKVFSWGFGEDGQLGHGDFQNYNTPQQIKFFNKQFATIIAAGHSHTAVVCDAGDLYMFGCNTDNRLMIKNNQNQPYPMLTELNSVKEELGGDCEIISVGLGVSHSAIVTKSGSVYTAGCGNDGQLGIFLTDEIPNTYFIQKNPDLMEQPSFVEGDEGQGNCEIDKNCFLYKVKTFSKKNKAISCSSGDAYTVVLNEKQQIFTFGKGSYNRLGHCDLQKNENIYEPRLISAIKNEKIVQIVAGCRHAAAVTEDGRAYMWGFNFYDQLGLGDSDKDYSKPTKLQKLSGLQIKTISCGYFHSGALIV